MQHLDEEFQAEVVDKDVDDGNKEIPNDLRPAFQRGTREADVACHPEAREEGNGELEHKSCDVAFEGNETQVDGFVLENKMV